MGQTCDGFTAGFTLLGVEAAKTHQAVGAVVSGGEVLPGELNITPSAYKTLLMPRLVPIGHPTLARVCQDIHSDIHMDMHGLKGYNQI